MSVIELPRLIAEADQDTALFRDAHSAIERVGNLSEEGLERLRSGARKLGEEPGASADGE